MDLDAHWQFDCLWGCAFELLHKNNIGGATVIQNISSYAWRQDVQLASQRYVVGIVDGVDNCSKVALFRRAAKGTVFA